MIASAILALLLQSSPIVIQPSTFGAPDIVLPSAQAGIPFYTVKVLPGAAATTVRAPGSETVDGSKTVSIPAGGAVTFRAVGGAWYVVSLYDPTPAAPGGAHELLSATHTDTTPATPPATGSLIAGKAGVWIELPRGTANQQVRVNSGGTDIEWFTPAAGAANAATTSVAVTSDGMYYSATVAVAWPTAGMSILCKPYGGGASTPTAESIAVSGIEAIVANIAAGLGFDVLVSNPYGLEGTVEFRCVGV